MDRETVISLMAAILYGGRGAGSVTEAVEVAVNLCDTVQYQLDEDQRNLLASMKNGGV